MAFGRPAAGRATNPLTSATPYRFVSPNGMPGAARQANRLHAGVDFPGELGEPVLAIADGTVQTVGAHLAAGTVDASPRARRVTRAGDFGDQFQEPFGAGLFVRIEHAPIRFEQIAHGIPDGAQPLHTRYLHLNEIFVSRGERVRAGQVIGTMGKTGSASGFVHLHFETLLAPSAFRLPESRCVDPRGFCGWHFVRTPQDLATSSGQTTVHRGRDGSQIQKPSVNARWGGFFRDTGQRFDRPVVAQQDGRLVGQTFEVELWQVLLCFPASQTRRGIPAQDARRPFTCNTRGELEPPSASAFCSSRQPLVRRDEPGAITNTSSIVAPLLPSPFTRDRFPRPLVVAISEPGSSLPPRRSTPARSTTSTALAIGAGLVLATTLLGKTKPR